MTCGDGLKTRTVQCSEGSNKCDPKTKPATSAKCNLSSCPQWRIAPWSEVWLYFDASLTSCNSVEAGKRGDTRLLHQSYSKKITRFRRFKSIKTFSWKCIFLFKTNAFYSRDCKETYSCPHSCALLVSATNAWYVILGAEQKDRSVETRFRKDWGRRECLPTLIHKTHKLWQQIWLLGSKSIVLNQVKLKVCYNDAIFASESV